MAGWGVQKDLDMVGLAICKPMPDPHRGEDAGKLISQRDVGMDGVVREGLVREVWSWGAWSGRCGRGRGQGGVVGAWSGRCGQGAWSGCGRGGRGQGSVVIKGSVGASEQDSRECWGSWHNT